MAVPSHPVPNFFSAGDGTRLAWREVGAAGGRPVLLLHGFISNAVTNWVRYGHAAAIADCGFRVIMPDLRGHGDSDRPHDPARYPPDVLMHDALALIDHLGLRDYDLGGYSLGARTAVRLLANGAMPRRAVLSGMGLQGLLLTTGRGDHFRHILSNLGRFEQGSPEWLTQAFLKTTNGDPRALLLILDTFVDTPADIIMRISAPTLVVSGKDDADNGSAQDLAEMLPRGRYVAVPGGHMSAVTRPELGAEIAMFLAAEARRTEGWLPELDSNQRPSD